LIAKSMKLPMITRNATIIHIVAKDIRLCVKMLDMPSFI